MEFVAQTQTQPLCAESIENLLLTECGLREIKGTDGDNKYSDVKSLWSYFYRNKDSNNGTKKQTALTIDEPEFYSQVSTWKGTEPGEEY